MGMILPAGAEQFAHQPLVGLRTVAHLGLEDDVVFHIVHGAGLGNYGFAGIEFHEHHLHVVADNLKIHVMTFHVVFSCSVEVVFFPVRVLDF
jgi:hypothetical protein